MISRNFPNFGTSANIRREICAKWRIWQFFPHDSGVIQGICAETRIISFLWKIRNQFLSVRGKRIPTPATVSLAWESVSPRLPLKGRCQREALTEGEMPRVLLSPSRLRRQPPPRGGLTARQRRGNPSPFHKFPSESQQFPAEFCAPIQNVRISPETVADGL